MKPILISCGMGEDPLSQMQAWNWLMALKSGPRSEALRPVIHSDDPEVPAVFAAAEAEIAPSRRGGVSYLETQILSAMEAGDGPVLLATGDCLCLACPTRLADRPTIGAMAHHADPAGATAALTRLWREAMKSEDTSGPSDSDIPALLWDDGLYAFPQGTLAGFGPVWIEWMRRAASRRETPDAMELSDAQLGFALALWQTSQSVTLIADAEHPTDPEVLRTADKLDNHGLLARGGDPLSDQHVVSTNARLRAVRRHWFSNEIFWNFRYRYYPELGSGIGSRGDWLIKKRDLLAPFAKRFARSQVVDIGFGDLEATRELEFRHYLGVDLSERAVAMARKKRPDWSFRQGMIADLPDDSADLVICLDVIIHIGDRETYRSFIAQLLRVSRGVVLASGYNSGDMNAEGIIFFHEPLAESFARAGAGAIEEVGAYSDASLLCVSARTLAESPPPDGRRP